MHMLPLWPDEGKQADSPTPPERACPTCGAPINDAKHPNRKYCSKACFSLAISGTGTIPCAVCGKMFRRAERAQRYCSKACYGENRRKPGNPKVVRADVCWICGKPVPKTGTKYCSRKCCAQSKRYVPEARIKQCAACGKSFEISAYHWRTRYCSRECTTHALTILPLLTKACTVCGTPFDTKKTKRKYCSQACKHEDQRQQWAAMTPEERASASARVQARMERVSGLERTLCEILDEWRVPYETQYQVLYYYPDIYIPRDNLVIEAFGCYWHDCPACGFTDRNRTEHDKQRLEMIAAAGYHVAVIWEHEIRADPYEALNAAFRRAMTPRA